MPKFTKRPQLTAVLFGLFLTGQPIIDAGISLMGCVGAGTGQC